MFVAPWLTPFCFGAGVLTLALFAFLAAVYLTVETREVAPQEDFRRRALGAALVMFATARGTLALALLGAPHMGRGLTATPWAPPLHMATAAASVAAIGALWTRRYGLARLAAAAQVSLIVWGWALAQSPYLVPPTLTIAAAAAPGVTLTLVLWALAGGAFALFPSLVYLFRIFKRQPEEGSSRHSSRTDKSRRSR
ncbi:MAG: cytochrome d ubiquinol oxidase subunit II [Candidatus Entotheonellia bacterium]